MTAEQAIETAIKDALTAANTGGLVYDFRGWWLDDAISAEREDTDPPIIAVKARPWVPAETATVGNSQVEIAIVTRFQDDAKRSDLAALYALVRAVIDANAWTVSAPLTALDCIITDSDTFPDAEARRNVCTLAVDADICVDEDYEED